MSKASGVAWRDKLGMQCSSDLREVRENARAILADFSRLERDLAAAQAKVRELEAALQYVLEDDGLIPRATNECRRVVREALAARKESA